VSRAYYVTTPIYYANADPHIGSAYTFCVADSLARWHRQAGLDTWLVTGTDEHGEKIAEAAAQRGLAPKLFADEISARFRATWDEVGLSVDRFVRTTEPDHVRNVKAILSKVHADGWIEKRDYEGLYCVGCERFLMERDLVNGLCADHERAPEPRSESSYFFRMSREFGWLRRILEERPDFIRPERYRNEALAMLRDESGLGDLSISRPKARLDWGIELPFDPDYVCYVWFDALISYLTGAGYPDDPKFAARWAGAEHVIGKDILKPHAIFWPIMLKAMGLDLPRHIHVHGYWTVEGKKMSKSLGNALSPLEVQTRYGFEPFRYVVLREMSFGLDADLREAAIVERINADLANNLGNLVSRTLNLVERFCDGRIPEPAPDWRALVDTEIGPEPSSVPQQMVEQMDRVEIHRAVASVFELTGALNRYFDQRAPWKAIKDPATAIHAHTTLYTCCAGLRAVAVLLRPFMPKTGEEILTRLGVAAATPPVLDVRDPALWDAPLAGSRVTKGTPLFPRLEAIKPE